MTTPATTREHVAKKRKRTRDTTLPAAFKAKRWRSGEAKCDSCGWQPPVMLGRVRNERLHKMLHAHHVVPLAAGGPDHESNLVLLCPNHHAMAHAMGNLRWQRSKTGKPLKHRRPTWNGATTPAQLLDEIRWVETDMERWIAHVDGGRDHQQTAAVERRSSMMLIAGNGA